MRALRSTETPVQDFRQASNEHETSVSQPKPVFYCPLTMRDHCAKVFRGEYDVPGVDLDKPRVLDLGACLGAFSIWATKRWPGCSIVAFEPHPDNYRLMVRNVSPWPVADVRKIAVIGSWSDAAGNARGHGPPNHVRLYDGGPNCGCASLYDLGEQKMTSQPVKAMLARELPDCDVIKLDTEGEELAILREYLGSDDPKGDPRVVLYEAHRRSDADELREFMTELGYQEHVEANPRMGKWVRP